MATVLEGMARMALRDRLQQSARRLGLTNAAVDELAKGAQIARWRPGYEIFGAADAEDITNFLVSGVVKVVCTGERGCRVTVQLVRPGQFFGLAWPGGVTQEREFGAVAHTDALVAMLSRAFLTRVVAGLPATGALQLMAYSWRALSSLLFERCLMATMPLRDRLLHVLARLADDFGAPHPDGIAIDVPLTHADLGEMVVATRANVSRAMSALARSGRLGREHGRIVVRSSRATCPGPPEFRVQVCCTTRAGGSRTPAVG